MLRIFSCVCWPSGCLLWGSKGQLFLSVEILISEISFSRILINKYRMKGRNRKSSLSNYHSNNYCRRELSIDTTISGAKVRWERGYLQNLKMYPCKNLCWWQRVKKLGRHHLDQAKKSTPPVMRWVSSCTSWWLNITSVIFLPKMHSLNLIMRMHQTNPNQRTLYNITSLDSSNMSNKQRQTEDLPHIGEG